jgi:hypothetical protein
MSIHSSRRDACSVAEEETGPGHHLFQVALATLDGCADGLRPHQNLSVGATGTAVATFLRQCSRDVGDGVRVNCKRCQPAGNTRWRLRGRAPEGGFESVQLILELLARHRLCSLVVGERGQGLTGERERVLNPVSPGWGHHGTADYVPTGVSQSDQVPRQIPAID